MKKFFVGLISAIGILILCGVITIVVGIISSRHIEVNTYEVSANVTENIRIVHLTDLHNSEFGPNNKKLVKKVQKQNPDLICITGDMINRDDDNLAIICNLIEQLTEIAPVYFGYGNHEFTWEDNFQRSIAEELSAAGAIVVHNSYEDIEVRGQKLCIGGCMNYYRKWGMMTPKEEWAKETKFADDFEASDRVKILLNHIPTSWIDWKGMDEYPVDIVFSGHYHGGMIRIPIWNRGVYAPYIGLFPENTKGVFYGAKATCILSAGLGTEHAIPRIFNPPEIVVVDLVPN